MRHEKITLHHQELLTLAMRKLNCYLSEYSFASIYLFRNTHQYELIFGKKLFIKGKTRDGIIYYMPMEVPSEEDYFALKAELNEKEVTLFPIFESWKENFSEKRFSFTSLDSDSDYIFCLKKMRHYPGRHLSGQRNFVTQFTHLYSSRAVPLNEDSMADAIKALQTWNQAHLQKKDSDYEACLDAIKNYQILGLTGFVHYVEETPVALAIGEPLTENVYVAHFMKGDTAFKGIYPYIYQHFALQIEDRYNLLNFEQDLGIPGMKKAKQSYHPEKLLAKWRVSSL